MRNFLAIGLVALAAACGQKEDHSIQYAAPRAPAASEQTAIGGAQTTLSANLSPLASSQPTVGLAGLADQLAMALGNQALAQGAPAAASAKLADPVRQAFDMSQMPACVTIDQPLDHSSLSVSWNGCHLEQTDATGTTIVDIGGTLTWSAATGITEWHIQDHTWMSMTDSGTGQTVTMDVTANLDGKVTVTADRISGGATSRVLMTYGPLTAGLTNTVSMDLGYTSAPAFCVTSGWLDVTQVWNPRPMGATYATLPDLGWKFTWTGCNQFTVAPGQST